MFCCLSNLNCSKMQSKVQTNVKSHKSVVMKSCCHTEGTEGTENTVVYRGFGTIGG
jgi:hypothetical protein